MKAIIDPQKCDGNPFCRPQRVCPYDAIDVDAATTKRVKYVIKEKCTGCALCIPFCDKDAIKMTEFIESIDSKNE